MAIPVSKLMSATYSTETKLAKSAVIMVPSTLSNFSETAEVLSQEVSKASFVSLDSASSISNRTALNLNDMISVYV